MYVRPGTPLRESRYTFEGSMPLVMSTTLWLPGNVISNTIQQQSHRSYLCDQKAISIKGWGERTSSNTWPWLRATGAAEHARSCGRRLCKATRYGSFL